MATAEQADGHGARHSLHEWEEPRHLCCPITHALYEDPVVAMSGNTYERAALLEYWEQQGQLCDPLTNVALQSSMLIPNWDKRREVESFLSAHPSFVSSPGNERDGEVKEGRVVVRNGDAHTESVCRIVVERAEEAGLFSLRFSAVMPESLRYRVQQEEYGRLILQLNERLSAAEQGWARKFMSTAAFTTMCIGLTLKRPQSCLISGSSLATFVYLCSLPDGGASLARKQEAERYFSEEFAAFFLARGVLAEVVGCTSICSASEIAFTFDKESIGRSKSTASLHAFPAP
eukprot:TRINITY_DN111775_c0_g1_i1.p1 TRINITY_DN111775_c0_g1~~TRINITY_DN111775_c0_g1_i1.p1  ORF type:complete len:289 (-),score=51.65 TRINITY_DN111775_c0_g1_i1:156-1022(-)